MARKTPLKPVELLIRDIRVVAPEHESLSGDTLFGNILIDSMDHHELIELLEEDFGVTIPNSIWKDWSDQNLNHIAESLRTLAKSDSS